MESTTVGTTDDPTLIALNAAGEELKQCDQRIAEFKREHMVTINGRQCFQSATVSARPALDAELRALLRARDKVWQRHQQAMSQLAEIKMQRGTA